MNDSTHCDHELLGAFPISESAPAGTDPRLGDAYAAASMEIEKLNNLHAQGGVDWQKLSSLCEHILATEGKDFSVGVWLLCAWTRLHGLTGLAAGVRVLKDLITLHWTSMSPPLTRLRARRNTAIWLLEWLDKTLQQSFEPVKAESLQQLRSDWSSIDAFWQEHDDDAPGFIRLRRQLSELTSLPSEPVEQAPVAASALENVELETTTTSQIMQTTNAAVFSQAISALDTSPASAVTTLNSDEAIVSALERFFESLAPLQSLCLEQRPTSAVVVRLNRQAVWLTLQTLPASLGRTTRLPAPPESHRESLLRLQHSADPMDVVRFCEGRISSFPFWLDLNRASHAALTRLGAQEAADALALETYSLISRLPGLADLTFAEAVPFADGATQLWLNSLVPQNADHQPSTPHSLDADMEAAYRIAAEGRLSDALAELQGALTSTAAERDRFRLRSAQCALIHRFDPQAQLRIPLESLLTQADEMGLAKWEPDLLKPLLEMVLDYSDAPQWPQHLARFDVPALWQRTHA